MAKPSTRLGPPPALNEARANLAPKDDPYADWGGPWVDLNFKAKEEFRAHFKMIAVRDRIPGKLLIVRALEAYEREQEKKR